MLNLNITYTPQNGIFKANVSEITKQITDSLKGEVKIEITKDVSELGFRKTRNPFQRLITVNGKKEVAVISPSYL